MTRALCGGETVKRNRAARCLYLTVAKGVGTRNGHIPEYGLARKFNALRDDGIDIAALPQILTNRDIGYSFIQLVVE